jgi:hypothetical protein
MYQKGFQQVDVTARTSMNNSGVGRLYYLKIEDQDQGIAGKHGKARYEKHPDDQGQFCDCSRLPHHFR